MNRIEGYTFDSGVIYVFAESSEEFRSTSILYGIDVIIENNRILLDVATSDFKDYIKNYSLPISYLFVREAKYDEVRDFSYSQGLFYYEFERERECRRDLDYIIQGSF